MNFATILDASVVTLACFWMFLVVDGIMGAAIACWSDSVPRPETTSTLAPVCHYACPLTCELPEVVISAPVELIKTVEIETGTSAVVIAPEVTEEAIEQPLKVAKRLTYSQQVKARASKMFGYPISTKEVLKSSIINRSDLSFMGAVNLERTGKDFYQVVDSYLDLIEKDRVSRRAAC